MVAVGVLPILMAVIISSQVNAYNILFATPIGAKSHLFALTPVAEELARRGHKVTMMTAIKQSPNILARSGIKEVYIEGAAMAIANRKFNFFMGSASDKAFFSMFMDTKCSVAEGAYADPFVQDLINNNGSSSATRYDVMVIDAVFTDYMLPIAHHLRVPTVYLSPSIVLPHILWLMNVPAFYSSVPVHMMFAPGQMSFLQRFQSVRDKLGFIYTILYTLFPRLERITNAHLPESPSLIELTRNVSFLLSNEHESINPVSPTMPYFQKVGGLHLKPATQLPKELEEFMNNSGDAGVVYFSLGSFTEGTSMSHELRDKLLKGFARLPEKVLWKYESPLTELPKNVKIIKWAPQGDLLAHPKMRLFITHGGGLSIQEAGYHGCPVLGMALSAEQMSNVANVINAGFGEFLDWRAFTVDEFLTKARNLIDDERYKTNAVRIGTLMRDRIEDPVKTAAYWIEYVVRHNGAPHLKSYADQLNFFQYFLLDVLGAFLICVLIILSLVFFVAKKLVRTVIAAFVATRKTKIN